MPELPEVETIRRTLVQGTNERPSLIGMQVAGVHLFWHPTLENPSSEEFQARIIGQIIEDIGRRGKFILFQFSQDTLLIHLRMSGDLRLDPYGAEPLPHDRLIITFQEGWSLAFNDARKFGRAWFVRDPQQVTGHLGPEPLDESFTAVEFHQRLKERRRRLKPLLLDQEFLAGMGNIYTDEALHMARLHPLRQANTLSEYESRRLWESIRYVLQEGIRRNGSSIDWVYRGGDFQSYFRVYSRTSEPCPECGTPIERIVVGQRGTHFCPVCQPLPESSGC